MSIQIKNVKVYGLPDSMIRSGYPMRTGEPITLLDDASIQVTERDYSRIGKLSSVKVGTGHDTALKGIIVQFDLKYAQYFTPQLQRYSHIEIISSQSKMHSITSHSSIAGNCNKYVLDGVIGDIKELTYIYNNCEFPYIYESGRNSEIVIESKDECFHYIISNLPMGYEMWMGISTNYLQLKTIYGQRKYHKLNDWREFCQWIEQLPHSYLITNKKKENDSTSI